jgi:2-polyprenyl-3-methyl-5-hydroxy-6-metoxy-1,4-benzoquinol methylase
MSTVLQTLHQSQVLAARRIERLVPDRLTADGQQAFIDQLVPMYLRPGQTIFDVGGGKRPYLDADRKALFRATVIGLDIDGDELVRAPNGCYDRTVMADIATYQGNGEADLVICQAVLEHVQNVPGAMAAIASILAPGGRALIFVPCRNALFARLNVVMPEGLKQSLLKRTDDRQSAAQGFPSFYRSCTPSSLSELASHAGLVVERREIYWHSSYFYHLLPAYLLWRGWSLAAWAGKREDFCETFTLVLRKPSVDATGR